MTAAPRPGHGVTTPHADIREGRLDNTGFAANVWAVVQGTPQSGNGSTDNRYGVAYPIRNPRWAEDPFPGPRRVTPSPTGLLRSRIMRSALGGEGLEGGIRGLERAGHVVFRVRR